MEPRQRDWYEFEISLSYSTLSQKKKKMKKELERWHSGSEHLLLFRGLEFGSQHLHKIAYNLLELQPQVIFWPCKHLRTQMHINVNETFLKKKTSQPPRMAQNMPKAKKQRMQV